MKEDQNAYRQDSQFVRIKGSATVNFDRSSRALSKCEDSWPCAPAQGRDGKVDEVFHFLNWVHTILTNRGGLMVEWLGDTSRQVYGIIHMFT